MFSYRCFLCDVDVKHPYEPVKCKSVKCDYYIFWDDSSDLSLDDISCCINYFLAKKYSDEDLFYNFGLVIVPFYHDKILNSYSYLEIINVSSDMIYFISKTLN